MQKTMNNKLTQNCRPNNLPAWDETTIEERNKWIAGKVLDAWPK